MNAAETIAAAIEKLEHLRDAAADEDGVSWDVHSPNTGALIVTLHRTIDAQLAILKEMQFQLSGAPELRGFIGNEFNLFMRIAVAILGEAS